MKENFKQLDLAGIRAILVDIDDTLYDYGKAHRIAIGLVYDHHKNLLPTQMAREEFETRYRHFRTQVTNRLIGQGACRSRLLAFQALLESLEIEFCYVSARNMEDFYWSSLIENMSPNEDLIAWLEHQHTEGRLVCALTNMQARVQIEKLCSLGLSNTVSHLVTSEEVGREKPDPSMFAAALSKMGILPNQAIMLGDNQIDDIEGAKAVGIKACLITKYH